MTSHYTESNKDVVRRVRALHVRPESGPHGPSWVTFLGHITDSLWSIDLVRCESILLTSNQSLGAWGEVFGDPVIATAILDRLLHHSITVNIKGESYRLREKLKVGLVKPTRRRTQSPRANRRRKRRQEPRSARGSTIRSGSIDAGITRRGEFHVIAQGGEFQLIVDSSTRLRRKSPANRPQPARYSIDMPGTSSVGHSFTPRWPLDEEFATHRVHHGTSSRYSI